MTNTVFTQHAETGVYDDLGVEDLVTDSRD
jgi:hypothetical protein